MCDRRRMPAQSLVEVAFVLPLLILAGAGVVQFSLWMHAEGIVTAAVQDGARIASSEAGTLEQGTAAARLAAARRAWDRTPRSCNSHPARMRARFGLRRAGTLPAIFPWGPVTTIPLHASASMARDRFVP